MPRRPTLRVTKAFYARSLTAAYRKGLRAGAARKQAELDQFVARFRFLKGLNGDTDGFIRAWVETNRKGFDESKVKRDHGQFSSTPGGKDDAGDDTESVRNSVGSGGAGSADNRPGGTPEKEAVAADPADERAESLLARLAAVPRRVRERVGAFVDAKYAQLSGRYGDAGAKAVLGATVLLLPVPVPGTSFIPVALAEAVLRLRRAVKGKPNEEPTDTEVKALAAEFAKAFDPAEKRDDAGKWTGGGGGGKKPSLFDQIDAAPTEPPAPDRAAELRRDARSAVDWTATAGAVKTKVPSKAARAAVSSTPSRTRANWPTRFKAATCPTASRPT